MKSKKIVITQGQSGAVLIAKNKNILAPAFSDKLVDKIGAGDTLLVLLSLCLKAGFKDEVAIFVASVAAGMSTAGFANSQTIDKNELLNKIKYYLK
jgi:bifunctional ADP-heptose synthase (sugar kinase/adenylyltransferase)